MCLIIVFMHVCVSVWLRGRGPLEVPCHQVWPDILAAHVISEAPTFTVIFTASSPDSRWQFSNLAWFRYQNAFFSHHCRLTVFS